ncbi:hypothetical protein HUT18_24160 [Streptomyces sp. NA04227]|uniref:hypothetical protein n=1 Tax=Streptomyces sp. NA04227 TaxID=2742136 RepID=UPI001590184A|nr:hypothetical protein [Streptomyces sp. NA04227]QKW09014.1 hypothetical protein HUT18_24160 [Streptomyces sp. NA04227]
MLRQRGLPHVLHIAGQDEPTACGDMPIGEFYDELPEQWRIEHPGAEPGARRVHEIRVGTLAGGREAEALSEELTRVLCPDPEHSSPCPVPWSSGSSAVGPDEDAERDARLNRLYGHLYGAAASDGPSRPPLDSGT